MAHVAFLTVTSALEKSMIGSLAGGVDPDSVHPLNASAEHKITRTTNSVFMTLPPLA
jgi:hypothetical protein